MEKTIETILPIILIFIFAGGLCTIDAVWQRKCGKKRIKETLLILVQMYFLYVLVRITLLGRAVVWPRKVWLIPLLSYYKYLSNWEVFLFRQDLQNVLLFCPFGFFLCALLEDFTNSKRRRNTIIVSALVLSLLIEIIQYITMIGVFETDDILHNVLGAILGCLIYEAICCVKVQKTTGGIWKMRIENRTYFIKFTKVFFAVIVVYVLISIIAYVNHLYHVHVLWR